MVFISFPCDIIPSVQSVNAPACKCRTRLSRNLRSPLGHVSFTNFGISLEFCPFCERWWSSFCSHRELASYTYTLYGWNYHFIQSKTETARQNINITKPVEWNIFVTPNGQRSSIPLFSILIRYQHLTGLKIWYQYDTNGMATSTANAGRQPLPA